MADVNRNQRLTTRRELSSARPPSREQREEVGDAGVTVAVNVGGAGAGENDDVARRYVDLAVGAEGEGGRVKLTVRP